jgi:hypothetical protein
MRWEDARYRVLKSSDHNGATFFWVLSNYNHRILRGHPDR